MQGDAGVESFSEAAIKKTIDQFGKFDILINNAGTHRSALCIAARHTRSRMSALVVGTRAWQFLSSGNPAARR